MRRPIRALVAATVVAGGLAVVPSAAAATELLCLNRQAHFVSCAAGPPAVQPVPVQGHQVPQSSPPATVTHPKSITPPAAAAKAARPGPAIVRPVTTAGTAPRYVTTHSARKSSPSAGSGSGAGLRAVLAVGAVALTVMSAVLGVVAWQRRRRELEQAARRPPRTLRRLVAEPADEVSR